MRTSRRLPPLFPGLLGALAFACRSGPETGPAVTPSGASLAATVTYAAGGTAQVSGAWGTWCNWRTIDTALHQMSLTAQASGGVSADSLHPALAYVSFAFRGVRFDTLPDDYAHTLGPAGADTLLAGAGTAATPYHADSGTVRLRRRGGGFARVDFDAWYSSTYVALAPRFRVTGAAEVPGLAACDLP